MAINIDFLMTCGNNLKRLASIFPVVFHFYSVLQLIGLLFLGFLQTQLYILAVQKSVKIRYKASLKVKWSYCSLKQADVGTM